MENLKIIKQEFKHGVSKKTGKPWTGLEIELQGSEKFSIKQILFLNNAQYQMLGLEKPENQ